MSGLRGGRRRRIPYLVLGVLLVLACASGFVVISAEFGNRLPVLALTRPVTVGQMLTAQDLRQVNVAVDPDVSVVDVAQAGSLIGKRMSTSLPVGALLSAADVGGIAVPAEGQAVAALALKAGQFPPEISPGTHVSLVLVPNRTGAAFVDPPSLDASMAWSAVVVGVVSPPNEQTTVVSLQLAEDTARLVAAVPAGQLALVMLSSGGGR
ncbi:SAF domain-containing protein [Amycolatopsis pigmentata]|uniref:SAF domain-containing protein n=1 Tax=Amycolatopsis pigmentata TaxID=450801 RepID=A0ABW5FK61_9PSEU